MSIEVVNPANDCGIYTIEFANDLAAALAMQEATSAVTVPLQDLPVRLSTTEVGAYYLANMTDTQITAVTSTTVQVDTGIALTTGLGVEVRKSRTILAGALRTIEIC